MTKRTALSILFALLFVPPLIAGDAEEVEKAERAWAKAMVQNDFDTLEGVLADDLYYSHSNFAEDTKRSYIDNLKSGKARYYVLDIQSLKVQIVDDMTALAMAVAVYETRAADGSRQTATLKTLHVYRKNNGQWQMRAHQSARKPD